MDFLVPLIEQLGFGGLTGAVAGYAAKKVTKWVAIALGLIFILLQLLAYKGFIAINWGEIGSAAQPHLVEGGRSTLSAIWRVLTHNLPFGAAFAGGFWLGFKKG
jgi:uncharacterized membrane protein (Fun14 family)